jgi:hypothetical protein
VFWVISVYFNIRNTLPKSGTFILGHPVYVSGFILLLFPGVVNDVGTPNRLLGRVPLVSSSSCNLTCRGIKAGRQLAVSLTVSQMVRR